MHSIHLRSDSQPASQRAGLVRYAGRSWVCTEEEKADIANVHKERGRERRAQGEQGLLGAAHGARTLDIELSCCRKTRIDGGGGSIVRNEVPLSGPDAAAANDGIQD